MRIIANALFYNMLLKFPFLFRLKDYLFVWRKDTNFFNLCVKCSSFFFFLSCAEGTLLLSMPQKYREKCGPYVSRPAQMRPRLLVSPTQLLRDFKQDLPPHDSHICAVARFTMAEPHPFVPSPRRGNALVVATGFLTISLANAHDTSPK